jgi:hypothetical protein
MNNLIIWMLLFMAGLGFGHSFVPPKTDRYVVEYHHPAQVDDIGLVKLTQKDVEELIR